MWNGEREANATYFCVSSEKFYFHGTNQTGCGTARRVAFRRMETGGNVDYTLKLHQGSLDPRQVVEEEMLAMRQQHDTRQMLLDEMRKSQEQTHRSIMDMFRPCVHSYNGC